MLMSINHFLVRFTLRISAHFLMNSIVSQYFSRGTLLVFKTVIAKSFVMNPFSTASMTLASRVLQKLSS